MMSPLSPNVVCNICKIPMILDTMGVNVAEVSDGHPPRIIYKAAADKYICPLCGFSVLTGYGYVATSEDKFFNNMTVDVTTLSPNHVVSFSEIESVISELRMLAYALEMKRDNLQA